MLVTGLARFLPETNQRFPTNQSSSIGVRGSIGYTAPEYGMGSEVSAYGDVYSFGVLLLEMFTGKRPVDEMFKDNLNLHKYAKAALPDRVEQIADPVLFQEVLEEHRNATDASRKDSTRYLRFRGCLVSIVGVGVSCSAELVTERMNIRDVATELHKVRNVLLGTRRDGEGRSTRSKPLREDILSPERCLKAYGGDEGWVFIEGDAYKLLIETILDVQDKREEECEKDQRHKENNLLKDDPVQKGSPGKNDVQAVAGPSGRAAATTSEVLYIASQTIKAEMGHILAAEGNGKDLKGIAFDQNCGQKYMATVIGNFNCSARGGMPLDSNRAHSPPVIPLPAPVNSLSTGRRRPCHGWIGSDGEDDDFIELPPAVQLRPAAVPGESKKGGFVTEKRSKRKTRWDVRPEDM